ncbi:MAG: adenylate/guanylate cyclase domain-containing protein [Gammaproteobacteria bacterium]
MFHSLKEKIRHILITLRVSILSIFVTFFVIAILTLIIINYYNSSHTLVSTSINLIQKISQSVFNKLNDEFTTVEQDDKFAAEMIQNNIVNPHNINQMIYYTFSLADQFDIINQVYWGDQTGNIINAHRESNNSITSEIINRTIQKPITTYIYRNNQGKIIRTSLSYNLIHDPRNRLWYKNAINYKNMIWTDIYKFEELPYLGVTVATPVFLDSGKFTGVIAIDVRLDWISNFISKFHISRNGIIYVVAKSGELVAYPNLYVNREFTTLTDIHSVTPAWVARSFDLFKKAKKSSFSFRYEGQNYLAAFNSFAENPQYYADPWIVGVVAPENDFIGKLKLNSLINALIGILVLVVGLLLVSTLITYVINPIKRLVAQTEKIRRFELDDEEHIDSRIKEVYMLSSAINAMRIGLKSFKKYIPAGLVRQLIKTGEDIRIGGTRRELTVLFSDIKGFTNIAERINPDELMETMNEYFEELSQIITREKGTIDKYIGDSIMAFWGAPAIVEDPVHHAAKVALLCERRLDELNELWRSQNKDILFTRFGIHIGEAIVGNIGSSERINYTAIGDVINIASRLEQANKIYGTRIMVSESVYEIIKNDFILRKVDKIALKGKSISFNIYELLAKTKQELKFDFDAYCHYFNMAFDAYLNKDWYRAKTLFEISLKTFPDDTLARVFIQRCIHFIKEPPQTWDGIWYVH